MKDENENAEPVDIKEVQVDPFSPPLPSTTGQQMINIQRPAYSMFEFNKNFNYVEEEQVSCCQKIRAQCSCTTSAFLNVVLSTFPFIKMFRNYQWKSWFVWDIIAGISVGVIHIPQSMGFALLANVPPVYGLYSTLFPVLIYFFFGTSNHISIGTMAVPSIMISSVISRQLEKLPPEYLESNGNLTGNGTDFDIDAFKVDIATSVTLIMGAFQVGMSLLRLGLIATFMSMPFVGGFLVGAACIIITSQVPSMLGLKLPTYIGAFRLPKTWYAIFSNIVDTNPAEVIIAVICLTFLVIVKMIINEKYKDKIKIPIPAELIVVVFGTIASHYAGFNDKYNVRIIGDIPSGIPPPKVPSLLNATDYILDGFIVAIVSFAISISMAKMYSQKYRYPIDNNQEMLAYGLAYGISSFLSSFAGAQAPPRTLVHDTTGGKTQLASIWSALLVLLVCLFLGPLFYSLPNSVLASVIVVALLPLFRQFKDLKTFLKVNPFDFMVWVVTWLSVIIIDISYGLVIGVGLSLVTIVVQAYLTEGDYIDGNIKESELYKQKKLYGKLVTLPSGFHLFAFESPLFFANTERFKTQLFAKTGLNPVHIIQELKENDCSQLANKPSDTVLGNSASENGIVLLKMEIDNKDNTANNEENIDDVKKNKHIENGGNKPPVMSPVMTETTTQTCVIIDCSGITYIDIMGLNVLKQLRNDYKEAGLKFVLAGCRDSILGKLRVSGYTGPDGPSFDDDIYPTVHDAVMSLQSDKKIMVA